MGMRKFRFLTGPLYLSFLLTLPTAPPSSPDSRVSHLHGRQFFRINLFHCNLSTGCSSFMTYPPPPVWSPQQAAGRLPAPPRSPPATAGDPCSGTWSTTSICSRSLLGARKAVPLTADHHFGLPYPESPRGATIAAAGLSCALRWGCWSWLEAAVSSTGQLWPPLTLQPP